MEHTINNSLKLIHNIDETTLSFLKEWHNDLPYIIATTSGSTGTPKSIKLLKKDMIKSAMATCNFFYINEDSTLVLPLSTNYIAGKMMIVRAIVSKSNIWIEQPSNQPLKKDYGIIDLIPVVPSQIDWIISGCQYNNKIKTLLVGGGNLTISKEKNLLSLGIDAYVSYGMTETCSHIALRKISNPIYETLSGISISQDSRNCLIINAPQFSYKHLVTNDIIELIDDKHFIWKGRYDNVINTGGVKIYPEKIEYKLSQLITQPFYIIGEKDEFWGEIIVLYIEAKDINKTRLLEKISEILDKFEIPKKIVCVETFKYTHSGKIKRLLL